MSHRLTVHALDNDGRPLRRVAVKIFIEGFWKGGDLREDTDGDGHAHFETADDYESSRDIYITVRGQRFGPYDIGGGSYTVQLD